ncbi:serine/threonine protein kinase [Nocardiopsis sp. HNM0947]|uniref:Serine/threonine protein kinase n=1 Tax=Nocardiopsis coralli TaxID=2772213 RepID=A0ABR9P2J8_9ACTN|nr:serine/threonine-protein kinase [Nocardiopsis coralli]MBE2998072.1 serine/threonine protein kinase [Nocardiopsis coralli]
MTPSPLPRHDHDPNELGGHEILGRLGAGGQGTVFLARSSDGTRVAVKTLNAEGMADPEVRRRFEGEARAAHRVASFCTAAVLGADFEASPPYIVSEYVEGPTLHQSVRDSGPLGEGDLNRMAVAVATALVAIHEAGIVHRDLKPGNVLMAQGGARVIDFGIAQVTDGAGTVTHSQIGTPAFMSPEQISDGRVGPATDVFAWGAVVAFAASGRASFDAGSLPAVLHNVMNSEPDLSAVPEPLRPLVAAALSKDPAQRPSSLDVLHTLLGRTPGAPDGGTPAGGGAATLPQTRPVEGPGPQPPYGPGAQPEKAPRRRPGKRALLWTGVAVACALLLVGGFIAQRALFGGQAPWGGGLPWSEPEFDPSGELEYGAEIEGTWEGTLESGGSIAVTFTEGETTADVEFPDAEPESCSDGALDLQGYTDRGYEFDFKGIDGIDAENCLGAHWAMIGVPFGELHRSEDGAELVLDSDSPFAGDPHEELVLHRVEG